MKKSGKNIYKYFILGFLLLIVTPIWTDFGQEILGDSYKAFKQNVLHGSRMLEALLWISVAALITYIITRLELGKEPSETDLNWRREVLQQLKQQVQKQIHQKLAHDIPFEIKPTLCFSEDEISASAASANLYSHFKDYKPASVDELTSLYIDQIKRLLIIGDPGAGKTVLLLNMVIKLIEIAEVDEKAPIPLIFDLSDYNSKCNYFTEMADLTKEFTIWLDKSASRQLQGLGLTNSYAQSLISNYKFIPVLDGLDEINQDREYSPFNISLSGYLGAISKYVSNRKHINPTAYPEILITCRTKDFESGDYFRRLPFDAIVKIEPIADLIEELKAKERNDFKGDAHTLLQNINRYPNLANLLTTAFSVHIALKLCRYNYNFQNSATEEDLLSAYIKFHLAETNYEVNKATKWLKWIAHKSSNLKFSELDIYSLPNKLKPVSLACNVLVILYPCYLLTYFFFNHMKYTIAVGNDWFSRFVKSISLGHVINEYIIFGFLWLSMCALCLSIEWETKSVYAQPYDPGLVRKKLLNLSYFTIGYVAIDLLSFYYLPFKIVYGMSLFIIGIFLYTLQHQVPIFQIKTTKLALKSLCVNLFFRLLMTICVAVFITFMQLAFATASSLHIPVSEITAVKFNLQQLPHNISILYSIVAVITFATSTYFSIYVDKALLSIFKIIPAGTSKFLDAMVKCGLLTYSNDTYRFRHILIKNWFNRYPG